MIAFDAFVKDRHGLIGGSNLYLHKIGLIVSAHRAVLFRPIDIFPGTCTSQNIVHHFSGGKGPLGDLGGNGTGVWAGRTKEKHGGFLLRCVLRISDLQQRSIQRTKPHFESYWLYYVRTLWLNESQRWPAFVLCLGSCVIHHGEVSRFVVCLLEARNVWPSAVEGCRADRAEWWAVNDLNWLGMLYSYILLVLWDLLEVWRRANSRSLYWIYQLWRS